MNSLKSRFEEIKSKLNEESLKQLIDNELISSASANPDASIEDLQSLSKLFSTTIKSLFPEENYASWEDFDERSTKVQVELIMKKAEENIE